MAVEFLANRLKALFIILLGLFKRALCCLRRRRRSSCDAIPLAAVGVLPTIVNNNTELEQWDHWEESPVVVIPDKPINPIQAKIDQYRQQATKSLEPELEEAQTNFFEDMTPKITKQLKILVKDKQMQNQQLNPAKFAVISDPIPTNDLQEWEENTVSWEGETIEEFGDPAEVLREQRRKEREQRLLEQQLKRQERCSRPQPLAAKLNS
ncbi:receptor-binding cancer antigen expressed on SiSo cells-like [Prorops nasuta]|uniref:receptor-binding cancer antigen expressed on SiSo cells-like n=1 Tax=Prorops nasuta TaxID=863751 RepID=UPI0034CD30AA